MSSSLIFLSLTLFVFLITFAYHNYQNKGQHIGGAISSAKSFWLGYAVFCYFILPVFMYKTVENEQLILVWGGLSIFFYIRLFMQGLLMYKFKKWRPAYGITFNIVGATAVFGTILFLYFNSLYYSRNLVSVFNLAVILVVQITDTYYAAVFNRIVGQDTIGDKATWFASDDGRFINVVQKTRRNNVVFFILALIMIYLIHDVY